MHAENDILPEQITLVPGGFFGLPGGDFDTGLSTPSPSEFEAAGLPNLAELIETSFLEGVCRNCSFSYKAESCVATVLSHHLPLVAEHPIAVLLR